MSMKDQDNIRKTLLENSPDGSHAQSGLGEQLKRKREEKGFSRDQVAQITRLRVHFIEALEKEDWRSLPASVFVKGFIKSYAKAVAAGFATASALGAVWPFIPYGGFLWLLIAIGIGYAIGEVVSLAVNRKRGIGLQMIAGSSMLLSYVVRSLLHTQPHDFLDSFISIYGLIALVLGIIVAVSKLR